MTTQDMTCNIMIQNSGMEPVDIFTYFGSFMTKEAHGTKDF